MTSERARSAEDANTGSRTVTAIAEPANPPRPVERMLK